MKVRQSNFELMRIISMLFIVLWHIIIHGHMIENARSESLVLILTILKFICVIHVNSFILLMGYFQSKNNFKIKKCISIILQVIFYSMVILIFGISFGFIKDYNYITFYNNITPNAISGYWFIATYLIVYCFSDYINRFINSLSKKELQTFIIVSFLLFSILPVISAGALDVTGNTGYNFYHFIFLYIVGAYLRMYPLKKHYLFERLSGKNYKIILVVLFCLCVYLNFSFFQLANDIKDAGTLFNYLSRILSYNMFNYSHPIVIIQSIIYLAIFETQCFKNTFLNYLGKYTFSVYLIHDNLLVRELIYNFLGINREFVTYKMLLYMLLIMLLIFVVCIFIDIIRDKLFMIIENIIGDKLKIKKKI